MPFRCWSYIYCDIDEIYIMVSEKCRRYLDTTISTSYSSQRVNDIEIKQIVFTYRHDAQQRS